MKPYKPTVRWLILSVFISCLFFSLGTYQKVEADIFNPEPGGGSIFDGILRGFDGIFDGFRGAFPGGAVIPGLRPTPTPGGLPGGGIPLPGSTEKVKLSLEWDALSYGKEAVDPSPNDPIESIHRAALRCPECGEVPTSTVDGCDGEGENRGECGYQNECAVAEARHVLYGWCGYEPNIKEPDLVPAAAKGAEQGPNTYTLPGAVSNKYIRRDGYYYQCVRACDEDGSLDDPAGFEGQCITHNYTEFQTEIYPSNAISMFLNVDNPTDRVVENVIIRIGAQYTGFPLVHGLDYPIPNALGTYDYKHGENLSGGGFAYTFSGIQLRAQGDKLVFGPFKINPGQTISLPLQPPEAEYFGIPGGVAHTQEIKNEVLASEPIQSEENEVVATPRSESPPSNNNGDLFAGISNLISQVVDVVQNQFEDIDTAIAPDAIAAGVSCGINIDPANPLGHPTPDSIAGSDWVRIEFKDCSDTDPIDPASLDTYRTVLERYKNAGMNTIVILDYVSFTQGHTNVAGFAKRAGQIANGLGDVIDAYEIWNEPDIPDYTPLSPDQFGSLLSASYGEIKGNDGVGSNTVVAGGLASGNPAYLQQTIASVGTPFDAVGVHPYGQMVDGFPPGGFGELEDLLNRYLAVSGGKPLWITEMGMNTSNQRQQADYIPKMWDMLQSKFGSQVPVAIWFAWSDGMVSPFGIVDAGLNRKEAHTTYFQNACGVAPPSFAAGLDAITPSGGPGCGGGGVAPPPVPFPSITGVPPSGKLGQGGIVPRDFNFVCDAADSMESARCNGTDDQVIIKPGSAAFDIFRDVTGLGGCGYNASSNNSVLGPFEVVAEYGGTGDERTTRSVLLGSIPIGGRLVDDQARPYGWPTTGEITQDWGYTGQAEAEGSYRNNPSEDYGEYRYCAAAAAPAAPVITGPITPRPTVPPGAIRDCGASPDPDTTDNMCPLEPVVIDCALNNAALKYGIDPEILRAVYEIESLPYISAAASGATEYACTKNFAAAMGLAQVTDGTYAGVTLSSERMTDDQGVCESPAGKMSRCDVNAIFELMARVLLSKVGRLDTRSMTAIGGLSVSEKGVVYNATCKYYGGYNPDCATCRYSYNLPNASRTSLDPTCREWDGSLGVCAVSGLGFSDNNYCDIVCNKLGTCPPYPSPAPYTGP